MTERQVPRPAPRSAGAPHGFAHRDHADAFDDRSITPPGGLDMDATVFEEMGPKQAVLYMAEQLKILREQVMRIDDRVESMRSLSVAVSELSAAVYVLRDTPTEISNCFEMLKRVQGEVAALSTRFASVERGAASATFAANRSWQNTNVMRGEVAKLSGHMLQVVAQSTADRAAREDALRELAETKRIAKEAKEGAEEAMAHADIGERYLDDLSNRASRGDALKDQLARAQLEVQENARKLELERQRAAQAREDERVKNEIAAKAKAEADELTAKAEKRATRMKAVSAAIAVAGAGGGLLWALLQKSCGG